DVFPDAEHLVDARRLFRLPRRPADLRRHHPGVDVKARLLTAVALVAGRVSPAAFADTITAKPPTTKDGKPYSAPTDKTIPLRVLWGDTHLHTGNSLD